jgi:hypothetical protein
LAGGNIDLYSKLLPPFIATRFQYAASAGGFRAFAKSVGFASFALFGLISYAHGFYLPARIPHFAQAKNGRGSNFSFPNYKEGIPQHLECAVIYFLHAFILPQKLKK